MLSDDMRRACSEVNLGWIMTTRCQGRAASDFLLRALATRRSIGDGEGVAQTLLNLARIHLLARRYESAAVLIREADDLFAQLDKSEGHWDCQRLLAKRALLLADYEEAAVLANQLLAPSTSLSRKDYADALLLKLEMLLWSGNGRASAEVLREVETIPATSSVHPLAARRLLLAGLYAMLMRDLDSAHKQISGAVAMFRESRREDLLLEGTAVMALLAQAMGNPAAGIPYLRYVEQTALQVRRELG
jgi:hypothetical protein